MHLNDKQESLRVIKRKTHRKSRCVNTFFGDKNIMTKERYHDTELEQSSYFDLDRAMRRFRQNCKELLGEFEIPAELEPYIEAYNRETVAKGGTPWGKL